MNTFTELFNAYSQLTNEQLLEILSFGNLPEEDGCVLAEVVATRFPEPKA